MLFCIVRSYDITYREEKNDGAREKRGELVWLG